MQKAAKKVVVTKNKKTDFFASSKSPKKTTDEMQIEEEEKSESPKKTKVSKDGALLPLDDFVDELYSWKPKLKSFTDSPKFKNIYSFIKKEYETKTV